MACRIKQLNKKTNVTYIYESVSYWDKEKKQPRNKKICIGKLDADGVFIPSKRLQPAQAAVRDPAVTASAEVVGPMMILDVMTERLGIKKILKSSFPRYYQEILMMAYYLTATGAPLSHCETWLKSHCPSLATSLSSQRISEIIRSITLDEKQTFLNQWIKNVLEEDYLCYDITSISSYSECNDYIKYGYNRDKEKLPQLNLGVLYGQKGRLPVYYERMPGNISDVSTLHTLLKNFNAMKVKKLNYVMDKGFYSKKNIDELFASKSKFLISVPLHNKWVQNEIDNIHDHIHGPEGYRKLDGEIIYVHSQLYAWGTNRRRCYLHLYYNAHARAKAVDQFNEDLLQYRQALESGLLLSEHQWAYDTFFVIKTTPKRGRRVFYNREAVNQHLNRYTGFQALLSNDIKDPLEALQVYRDKDVVEKSFDDLKNQLDMKRLRMHSSATVDGRLFVQFIALIYISFLRKEMRKSDLIERYTVRELLQEMNTFTKIKYSGKYGHILTELTKPQRDILECLNIELSRSS